MAGKGSSALAAVAAALALASGGCGGEGDTAATEEALLPAGGGGELVYAVPSLPGSLDPLLARGRAALTVTRQIHEPLIGRVSGPYGDSRQRPGLSLSATPSEDRTIWTIELRTGVRFQDGTPFNASAVLANARRWSATAAGRRLLPGLFAVDAPRPNEVRFLHNAPSPTLPRRLASARLGIVAPSALAAKEGAPPMLGGSDWSTGTGPFAAVGRDGARLELERNRDWWGTAAGAGPSLDGITIVAAPRQASRLAMLLDGDAQVADPLGTRSRARVAADPLLAWAGGRSAGIGMEASVRGIDAGRGIPLLSSVWLTTVAG